MIDFAELFAFCDLHATRWRGPRLAHLERMLAEDWPRYFDRQGFPIPTVDGVEPTLVWARMMDAVDRTVARDDLPDGSYLSTVWLGLDHGFGGPPLIFETMRFSAAVEESTMFKGRTYRPSMEFPDPFGAEGETTDQLRYTTEEEALATHHAIVRRIRIREGNA